MTEVGSARAVEATLDELVHAVDPPPVLVDVGASGAPPRIWQKLARHAVYVGFDPDRRDLHETGEGAFRRSIVLPEAVTDDPAKGEVLLHLTRSPHCSSTLEPDSQALAEHLFADLFQVERTATVRATTLSAALSKARLDRIDWLKLDTQGTDMRLVTSLPEAPRRTLLAVDVEPGLIDAYRGEDQFADTHRWLTREGFFLSRLEVRGTARMRPATLAALTGSGVDRRLVERFQRPSPGWCEARYLRTLPALDGLPPRAFDLLAAFAHVDGQHGFCLDLAAAREARFGADGRSAAIRRLAVGALARAARFGTLRGVAARVKRWVRRVGGGRR